jgi:hypothetical protein
MEEVKTLSANGTTGQNGAALDFDELTDLIKCVYLSHSILASRASAETGSDVPA